jgi:hypothetical protein
MSLHEPESVFWDLTRRDVSAMAEGAQPDRDHDSGAIVAGRWALWIRLDKLMNASDARRVRDLPDLEEATWLGWALGYFGMPPSSIGSGGDR